MAPKKKNSKTSKSTKASKKKPAKTKPAQKKKAAAKKAAPKKKAPKKKLRTSGKSQNSSPVRFDRAGLGSDSAGQSGSLQGLSNSAVADSESVDELLEEGNSFEAEVVEGVENASDADQGEVRTHEVPEDDVPEEYRDEDK